MLESGENAQAILVAELVEKLVVLLPGGDSHWDASCRTDRSRVVLEARMETRDAIVEASIEKSDAAALSAFDEAAYLRILTKLIAEGATAKKVLAQDAGQEAVLGKHVAQFLRLDEQGKSRSLHGYAARRLKNDVVLVLHVSETSKSLEREPSKKMLKNLLGLFGKEAELFSD